MPITPTFTTVFDLDSDSADFKKLILTDTFDYVAAGYVLANVRGYFRLTNPMGTVFYEGNFTTPDVDGSTPDLVHKQAIPLITSDPVGFMLGTYTLEYFVKIIGAPDEYYSTSYTYTFSPPATLVDPTTGEILAGCLEYEANCFCRQITLTDTTNYGSYTTLTRLITLHPPTLAAAADATTNNATLLYTFNVTYASYEYSLSSLTTFVSGYVTVKIRTEDYEAQIIKCTKLSAKLVDCFTKYANAWQQNLIDTGGRGDNQWNIDMFSLVVYFTEYNEQLRLGNWNRVDELYDVIDTLIQKRVSCPCECSTEVATFIDPYCGVTPGAGAAYTFAATAPITVTIAGSTITYGLDASFVTKVNSLYIDALESTDGSITITSSIAGSTKTWDLTTKNHCSFNAKLEYTAGNDLSVTISDYNRNGSRYLAAYPNALGDFQVRNYPHASIGALNAEYFVVFVSNFLTTPPGGGADVPDKIDVSIRELVRSAGAETDYNVSFPYRLEIKNQNNTGFHIQFFNNDGLPVTVADFIATCRHITLNIKINQ